MLLGLSAGLGEPSAQQRVAFANTGFSQQFVLEGDIPLWMVLHVDDLESEEGFLIDKENATLFLGQLSNRPTVCMKLGIHSAVSDAELMWRAYQALGVGAFKLVSGPFVAVIISRQTIVLAASKTAGPTLYVRHGANTAFAFASEIRALVPQAPLKPFEDIDESTCYRDPSWTAYANVQRIVPGHTLTLDRQACGKAHQRLYFSPWSSTRLLVEDEAKRALRGALERAAERLIPPEAAAFVSGGLDSSVIAYLAHAQHGSLRTYSLGSPRYNEFEHARRLADALHTEHTELMVNETQMMHDLARTTFCMEHPFSRYIEYVAPVLLGLKTLAEREQCVVSGYGADVLFGGLAKPGTTAANLVDHIDNEYLSTYWSNELCQTLHQLAHLEVYYPFWDDEVVQCALSIDPDLCYQPPLTKYILREAFRDCLPSAIIQRPKVGVHQTTGSEDILSAWLGAPPTLQTDAERRRLRRQKDKFCYHLLELFQNLEHAPSENEMDAQLLEAKTLCSKP